MLETTLLTVFGSKLGSAGFTMPEYGIGPGSPAYEARNYQPFPAITRIPSCFAPSCCNFNYFAPTYNIFELPKNNILEKPSFVLELFKERKEFEFKSFSFKSESLALEVFSCRQKEEITYFKVKMPWED